MDDECIELQLVGGDLFVDPAANCLVLESGGKTIEFYSIVDLNGLQLWYTDRDVEGWRYEESIN